MRSNYSGGNFNVDPSASLLGFPERRNSSDRKVSKAFRRVVGSALGVSLVVVVASQCTDGGNFVGNRLESVESYEPGCTLADQALARYMGVQSASELLTDCTTPLADGSEAVSQVSAAPEIPGGCNLADVAISMYIGGPGLDVQACGTNGLINPSSS